LISETVLPESGVALSAVLSDLHMTLLRRWNGRKRSGGLCLRWLASSG
jgi:hypothetical protein